MDSDKEIKAFIQVIRSGLPETANWADALLHERGWELEDVEDYLWVEALADVTNQSIHQRDERSFLGQVELVARQYDGGSKPMRNCIDVAYVENLMWNLPDHDKKWAWSRLPENLKKLYVAMWGAPCF